MVLKFLVLLTQLYKSTFSCYKFLVSKDLKEVVFETSALMGRFSLNSLTPQSQILCPGSY